MMTAQLSEPQMTFYEAYPSKRAKIIPPEELYISLSVFHTNYRFCDAVENSVEAVKQKGKFVSTWRIRILQGTGQVSEEPASICFRAMSASD